MNDGHLQIGYHGCDVTIRDGLVSGKLSPAPSGNQYDWLGPGFYLFEGDEDRAMAFAEAAASEPSRRLTARPIATPAVVGCVFSVQRCLDMTTKAGRLEFENAYLNFQAGYLRIGQSIPLNAPVNPLDEEILLRGLDRAVFNFIHSSRSEVAGLPQFQAVRGAFRQGPEIAPNSGFHRDSHVQIALRDFSCIRGWFLPSGTEQLSDSDLVKAQEALRAMREISRKVRQRVVAD
ncbi:MULTISPECIES: hypothetical protein [Stenotrophomonas]|jgi:hypothetical protein|uniref:hypothetical protein n=1 Tax=Stenotrophomonas sp. PS02300 TaxID=2991426 RepID=UPI00249B7AD8|nr:hypothetical protein [Stenotrophomonas sp. PS02300]